ncbi:MAG: TIGR00282 family metallophosphoesterase [Spirochaetales bacterium]|nr:TIGR00282 family metallophosphoesterase [Spirochaetales bacterium]
MDLINVLIIGDIVGTAGCRAVFVHLQTLKKKLNAHLVIANGENAYEGRGITPEIADNLHKAGVDVITSGNHIWQSQDIYNYMNQNGNLLRPENYPHDVPGKGHVIIEVKGEPCAVINLEGRVSLSNIRCPFRVGMDLAKRLRQKSKIIIIDFHAEWPEEKEALALYLDGQISALVGTHTHVQTADERILSNGTGYITDLGMTGPERSVIGMSLATAIKKNLTQMPIKTEVENSTSSIMGVLLTIDTQSGKTQSIKRIWEKDII